MPHLYNAYEAKLLNVLHSKLCKEKKKENDLIILGDLPSLKKSGLFSVATYPHILKVVYFQGRPAHTLTLVYFHGRPAHTYSLWSIFKGDLPF